MSTRFFLGGLLIPLSWGLTLLGVWWWLAWTRLPIIVLGDSRGSGENSRLSLGNSTMISLGTSHRRGWTRLQALGRSLSDTQGKKGLRGPILVAYTRVGSCVIWSSPRGITKWEHCIWLRNWRYQRKMKLIVKEWREKYFEILRCSPDIFIFSSVFIFPAFKTIV